MLTDKEKKLSNRLKDDLAMPKWKFILIYGLSFGLLMVIISSIMDIIFEHISLSELFARRFWQYLRTAPIAGLLFGLLARWVYTRHDRKLQTKEPRA